MSQQVKLKASLVFRGDFVTFNLLNIYSDKYVISPYDQKTSMLNSLKEYLELEQDNLI